MIFLAERMSVQDVVKNLEYLLDMEKDTPLGQLEQMAEITGRHPIWIAEYVKSRNIAEKRG